MIEWFEEYAEEFFQTHTELGDSLEVAEALVLEVQQFETSTKVRWDDVNTGGWVDSLIPRPCRTTPTSPGNEPGLIVPFIICILPPTHPHTHTHTHTHTPLIPTANHRPH